MNPKLLDKHINGMDFTACEHLLNYIHYLQNIRGVNGLEYTEMKNKLENRKLEVKKRFSN